jgi:hypothetical protein
MKRSSIWLIGILLVLAATAIYVYKKKGKRSTVQNESRDFRYKDTASVTRIFIADKDGNQCLLERTSKGWVVNKKYSCRADAILNLMEAIRNVEVKMPVSKNSRENVLRDMAAKANKVEIYAGEEKVKQYYVGVESPDNEGSYMLLSDPETDENYSEPYICFIPGFVGYLLPRYIALENDWRDRIIMNYTPPQMKKIDMQNVQYPDSSFSIEVLSTTNFKLKDKNGKEIPFAEFKIKQYLAYFQNVSYEVLLSGREKRLLDSLAGTSPFAVLTVHTVNFTSDAFKFYHKPPTSLIPEHGVEYKFDPDRMYLRFARDKEWALIQNYVFGKLLVFPSYFSAADVKK